MAFGLPNLISTGTWLLAQTEGEPTGGSGLSSLIFFGLIFVAFYFFLIRPQRKRQESVRTFQSSLDIGDEVRTAGGIIGVISGLNDKEVMLDVGGVTLKLVRGAIAGPAGSEDA